MTLSHPEIGMQYRLCTLPGLLHSFARSGATCSTLRPLIVSLREPVANVFPMNPFECRETEPQRNCYR